MPGGNKQTCKYYLKDFIEPSMNLPSHQTLKDEMSQDICPWLFQHHHFEKTLEKVLFFDLIAKSYKSKGLYFMKCLCVMTLSNSWNAGFAKL